jgi:hypothetical protein
MTIETGDVETGDVGELTFRRVHRASPELIFDCMTTPAHLTRFWGPTGTSTPVENIRIDLRPGGVFETTMVSDAGDGQYTMRAVYEEVPDAVLGRAHASALSRHADSAEARATRADDSRASAKSLLETTPAPRPEAA